MCSRLIFFVYSIDAVNQGNANEKNSVQPFVDEVVRLAIRVAAASNPHELLQRAKVIATCYGGHEQLPRIPDVAVVVDHDTLSQCATSGHILLSVEAKLVDVVKVIFVLRCVVR